LEGYWGLSLRSLLAPETSKKGPSTPTAGTMRPLEFSFRLLIMKMICFIKEKNYIIMTFPTGAKCSGDSGIGIIKFQDIFSFKRKPFGEKIIIFRYE
jgi:hypothetical protein